MAYWGSEPAENDYAFDAVGAYIYLIKERMLKDMATVLKKSYPEQALLASLKCLRSLGEIYPKCLRVHFGRSDFEQMKRAFDEWYTKVKHKLPGEYRQAIRDNANEEFAVFEERILNPTRPGKE